MNNTIEPLFCVSYFSKVNFSLHNSKTIISILDDSVRNNKNSGITGILFFSFPFFYQYFEGGQTAVKELWKRIRTDSRHTDVVQLNLGEVAERSFPHWAMKFRSVKYLEFKQSPETCKVYEGFTRLRTEYPKKGDIFLDLLRQQVSGVNGSQVLKDLDRTSFYRNPCFTLLLEESRPTHASSDAYYCLENDKGYLSPYLGSDKKLFYREIALSDAKVIRFKYDGEDEEYRLVSSKIGNKKLISIKPECEFEQSHAVVKCLLDLADDGFWLEVGDSRLFESTEAPDSLVSLLNCFSTESRQQCSDLISRAASLGVGAIRALQLQFESIDVEVVTRVFPLYDKDGKIHYIEIEILQSVTDAKVIEDNKVRRDSQVDRFEASVSFLANLSHEIRSPLHGMLGLIDSVVQGGFEDDAMERLEEASRCGRNLRNLINNVLDWTRLESVSTKNNTSNVDLRKLVEGACVTFDYHPMLCGASLLRILPDQIPNLMFDEAKVSQVLYNLLSNAAKYSNQKNVTVKVTISEQLDNALVMISVIDQGPGIPEEDLERLFFPYFQVRRPYRKKEVYKGTGLGLSISKSISQELGGDISVQSFLGRGSCFNFSFLASPVTSNVEVAAPSRKLKSKAASALIVDDSDTNLLILSRMLQGQVEKIEKAFNGKEAVEAVSRSYFDVVFIDISMPVMDGFEAIEKIKEEFPNQVGQFVILSGTTNSLTQAKARNMDVADFLPKPFDRQQILRCLDVLTSAP